MKNDKKKPPEVSCVDCKAWACFPDISPTKEGKREAPPYCPANAQKEVGEKALAKYAGATKDFARFTTLVENSCYAINQESGHTVLPMMTLHPRAEEIIILATIGEYKKLGIAFDIEMQSVAETYTDILIKNGFEVVSVCCKAGAISPATVGLPDTEKVYGKDSEETICSGAIMAKLLNSENTDMNILIGLGVGQDSLFYKYSNVFAVPLMVKDKVYGGATMEAVYQSFNSWGNRNYTEEGTNGFEFMRENLAKKAKV